MERKGKEQKFWQDNLKKNAKKIEQPKIIYDIHSKRIFSEKFLR